MSKELEALERIKKTLEFIDFKSRNGLNVYASQTELNIIENALERKEKLEKDLKDFEWLKSKLNITFLNTLSDIEDKIKLLEIMGIKYGDWYGDWNNENGK